MVVVSGVMRLGMCHSFVAVTFDTLGSALAPRMRLPPNPQPMQRCFFFKSDIQDNGYRQQLYLAFDYIKVYRAQSEPEFLYLSNARIPRVITTGGMVRHDRKEIREKRDSILDESDVLIPAMSLRSSEETYYKYACAAEKKFKELT